MQTRTLAVGASLIDFGQGDRVPRRMRSTNFNLDWIVGSAHEVSSTDEMFVIVTGGSATLTGHGRSDVMREEDIAICPPGTYQIEPDERASVIAITTSGPASDRAELVNPCYTANSRVAPIIRARRTVPLRAPLIRNVQDIACPPGNGRIRFIRSETMSINAVLYEGPRDRGALSPHEHSDIEQATVALKGDYIHHLRLPWGSNADDWQEDVHLCAGPGTMLLIPPGLIHTTEGMGSARHFMLDVFAPARQDFIDRGMVENAADYVPVEA